MKKVYLIIIFVISLFLFKPNVYATTIKKIDMDIYIDPNGNAQVTETWNASVYEGTEGYKQYYDIGNSTFTDFKVSDETKEYESVDNWNINASFDEKKYKNGINKVSRGIELCWGISSYGEKTYKLQYKINNFIYKTKDNYQMLYWTLIPKELSAKPQEVSIRIHSDQKYEDTLDVWGYGNYGGTAYVYDGVIEANSPGQLKQDEYMVLLVKFKENTFNIENNSLDNDFNYYYEMAEKGSTPYKTDDKINILDLIGYIIFMMITILISFAPFIVIIIAAYKNRKYIIYKNKKFSFEPFSKKLRKRYEYYRELPCNKDIYEAYTDSLIFDLCKKKTNLFGAVLLKWLKAKYIEIETEESKIFKGKSIKIKFLNDSINSDNENENKLYGMMVEASKDKILEENEFKKWCKNHYTKILGWFDNVFDDEIREFKENKKCEVINEKRFKIFNNKIYHLNEEVLDDGEKLAGLKRFFKEFTNMSKTYPIEVHMWEEYLMYAQIFGIAKQVAKDFKKLYPDVIEDIAFDEIIMIDHICDIGMDAANAMDAAARASSYSSGGGGFSSGGGGGGSFGGGSSSGGGFR